MGDGTGIEWTDATWNPLLGCRRISPGCVNCYAEKLSASKLAHLDSYAAVTDGRRWNGASAWAGDDRLLDPIRWGRPRRIFVCSMSDLFYDAHPVEQVAQVWATMAAAPHHSFQVLTKRADRMAALLADHSMHADGLRGEAFEAAFKLRAEAVAAKRHAHAAAYDRAITRIEDAWPLENVWLGVTAEDQERLDERLPPLLDAPAAVRFLSCEPLIGPVTIPPEALTAGGVSWVIVGGESGDEDVRPMHPEWARAIRDACEAAGVAFLFKQWGEWAPLPGRSSTWRHADNAGRCVPTLVVSSTDRREQGERRYHAVPADVHEDGPGLVEVLRRVGKRKAGRLLDGRTWDGFPA